MRKGRKWALLLVPALLLGLGACKNKGPKVALCFRQSDAVTAQYRSTLEASLTQAGYAVSVADGKNDQSYQTRQVEELLNQGCVLLVVDPVLVAEAQTLLTLAEQAQVPLIFINHEPEAAVLESWEKTCFIGCDGTQLGLQQGQIVLGLPQQGDVNQDGVLSYAVLAGPENHMDAQTRVEGSAEALADSGLALTRLTVSWGDWTEESGRERCEALLKKYGQDVEVLLCGNDAIAAGAARAISDNGWILGRDMFVIGIDGSQEGLALVQQEKLAGTVLHDTQTQAEQLLEAAARLLAGEAVENQHYITHKIITRQNAAEFMEK